MRHFKRGLGFALLTALVVALSVWLLGEQWWVPLAAVAIAVGIWGLVYLGLKLASGEI